MNNNNNNCQFSTPCCRCQLFKAVNASSSSSVSDLSTTPQQSQHLAVDPSKAPLSRFDLILLRSFQAAAAPAAAATASICSTTSSRQSSLVSTTDQQQLLQSIELGEYCSLSCCSSSSVEDHRDGGGGDELSGFLNSARLCQKRGTIEEQITEEEGTDDGIDCGQDKEKKNRHQQAALSATATATSTTTTATSNGHGQASTGTAEAGGKATSSLNLLVRRVPRHPTMVGYFDDKQTPEGYRTLIKA
uniref:Uncharacterized protein n=1 Tax=Globodera pallida TaxID=36090 RepID=A0A183CFN2_GLOPA